MRKFLLIISFVLFSLISFGQTYFTFGPNSYGTFKVSGNAECGVGNVYATIQRSSYVNNFGYYVYSIYFCTNSYFINCQASRTLASNIEVLYYDENTKRYVYPLNFYPFWVTVGQTSLVYTLYHPNAYLNVEIIIGNMQPTMY